MKYNVMICYRPDSILELKYMQDGKYMSSD